jgi:hypothetical protein
MRTADLKVGEHYAVVTRFPVRPREGILQHDAKRATLVEVYSPAKSGRRYNEEKLNARVRDEDGDEYDVNARRILGTWADRLAAAERSREAQERNARELAERTTINGTLAESLNRRQIEAGLVTDTGEPMVRFSVNYRGGLDSIQRASLRELIERVTNKTAAGGTG